MACLDKLTIQGIRNFSPDPKKLGAVRFGVPLTLIVGENGCGKTTIIECLKYAICGEAPLNTKSGGFVHDPSFTDFSEVMAQIGLSLRSVTGETLNVIRTVKATRTHENKVKFASVDQTISVKDTQTNQWVSIGGRCADSNTEMLMALGISKAIASHVIFCHQEESYWPLDESNKLKDKFDAIFDAVKYNKCLDHIKLLSKQYKDKLNGVTKELTGLETYKHDAANKRANLCSTETRMAVCKKQIEDLAKKLEPVRDKLKMIYEKEENVGQLATKRETLKTKLEGVKAAIADYKKAIPKEFSGSDQDLDNAIRNFLGELRDAQEEIEKLEKQINELSQEQKRQQSVISNEQVRIGQLTRDADKNAENIRMRNQIMNSLAEKLDISVSLSQTSDSSVVEQEFATLESSIAAKQENIAEEKAKNNKELEQLQSEIDSLREERAKMENNIENKKVTLDANQAEAAKVEADIKEVDQSSEKLGRLQTRLDKVEKELEAINKNNEIPAIDEEINELTQDREKHEDSLTLLEKEAQELQSLSAILTELEMKKNDRNTKVAESEKLRNRHQQSLKHLLTDVPEQRIQTELEAVMDRQVSAVQEKKKEIQAIEKKISNLELEKKHLSDQLKSKLQTVRNDESVIEDVCEGKDYNVYLAKVGKEVQSLQDQKGTLTSSEYMFRRYADKLRGNDPCCPLCHRGFSAEDEITQLVSELTLKVKEIPSRLRTNREQLDFYKAKHEKLLQLQPKHEKLNQLKTSEIPQLTSEIEEKEKELEKLKSRLEEAALELKLPESDVALCRSIHMDIVMLEKFLGEIKILNREISKHESKLPPGKKRTLKEALNDLKDTRAALSTANKKLEELQRRKTSISTKKHKLQEEKNAIQGQQIKITGNVQLRAQLALRREELDSIEAMLNMEIDQGMEDLSSLSRQLDNAMRLLKTTSTKNEQKVKALQNEIKPLEGKFEEAKKLHSAILGFVISCGVEKLKKAKENLKSLQKESDVLQEKKDSLIDKRDQLKTNLTNQKVRERELRDNQKLRQKRAEEQGLIEKMQKLKTEIGNADYESIVAEKDKLRKEEEIISREKAKSEGSQIELIRTLKMMRDELERDDYKNADKNYRDKLIEIKVYQNTINDLHYYHDAMDRAMKQYHHDRMKQVNAIIKDLWYRIYAGSDIDHIEIQMEMGAASMDKKRTYNYRVVQSKGGVALDMRGRCSAGQKVIASLIIRMALAETFSANCGILTLDEPTTNLDEQNIANLGQVLAELIKARKNKAFQLVVISHDQGFLENLSRATGESVFHFVHRDVETGRSKITRRYLENLLPE